MVLERFPRIRAFRNFIAVSVVLLGSVAWTLTGIDAPLAAEVAVGSSPRGYTRSLVLFLVPVAALAWWFLRHPECRFQKRAFWRSIGVLTPLGFGLDLAFANTFFRFPDHDAVLGDCVGPDGTPLSWAHASLLCIPARGGVVPVEEFVFYLSGFMVVLLTYIWADEYWLSAYNVADYQGRARQLPRLLRFHPVSLGVGGLLLVAVFAGWWVLEGPDRVGWPAYATFLIVLSVVPTVGLFDSAARFINWRAFAFTFFLILLVSLVWEVTLALPYGWWGYHDDYMMGLFIDAWFGLPIEAVCVWLAVTWTTVVVFEVVKVWQALGTTARRAFFG